MKQPYEILSSVAVDPDRLCYIQGRWESGRGAQFASINPATGSTIASWRFATLEQADVAVAAARESFDLGIWRNTTPSERAQVLHRIADLITEHGEELSSLVVAEVGSPITLARSMQTALPAVNFRWSADMAERGPRGGYEERLPPASDADSTVSVLRRQPVGVVTAITPYNYPINMIAWKIGPALAAGCSVVLMPSPRGTLSSAAFMALAHEAGVPPGVLNMVPGSSEVGHRLSSHPGVDMVSFTGSNDVGLKVAQAAAPTNKKVVLELGGKSPTIFLPGADLEKGVGPSITRFTRNAGQGCGSTTRILVHRADEDEFFRRAVEFLSTEVVLGDPLLETTDVGPLITAQHRASVEGYIERAVAGGATVIFGGGRLDGSSGAFLEPTLIAGVAPDDEICQEELFAPVAAVLVYDTVDEAVDIANNSRYGLNALVWGDPPEASALAERLVAGTVAINGGGFARPDAPWVGAKQSGVGVEMGEDGFAEFFTVKHLQWSGT